MPYTMNNANYKVLATAQMTITDETDASNLAGNLTVVNGSKSQAYITGSSNPYSPSWQLENSHLVLRPYMIATSIYRGATDSRYNPDLFSPAEYPSLDDPEGNGTEAYINDIAWYIVDNANNQTLIDINTDTRFSHTWIYSVNGVNKTITDERTLVIKDNILNKDDIKSIIVKFSFHDPFADIRIPVAYETQISCMSTGIGTTRTVIEMLDGNSFYNAADDATLTLQANYFNNGVAEDLNEALSSSSRDLKVEWFIKTSEGWTLLSAKDQGTGVWAGMYEIQVGTRTNSTQEYTYTKTTNIKGGTRLIIKPDLITGSDIIKLTITDDTQSGLQSSALEVIYDYSDPTQCYIYSSNGDKLYKGMDVPGTTLTLVITYKGQLLTDDDERYKTIFDYYWYRIDSKGDVIENVYTDKEITDTSGVTSNLSFIKTTDSSYETNGYPKSLTRSIYINPNHIDNKATFTCDLLNKKLISTQAIKTQMLKVLPSEEDIQDATIIVQNAGLSKYDYEEITDTASEIRAYTIAQENNTLNRGE